MVLNFERIGPSIPYILEGIQVTLSYTAVSLCLGFFLGSLLALCKISHIAPLRWFARFYTSLFRGTPLLVQLTLIYYATPQLIGYNISVWEAGILSFTLNSTAYLSEHFRSGIESIDKGQIEAALALGIPYSLMMRDIILPQAIRVCLPSLVNESIDLLKESALISIIGGADIMRRASIVANEKYLFFEPFLVAAVLYYVLVLMLTFISARVEKRMKQS
jgi:His/Glu/Gln/Arg/opine family amino acid ABC transporter permease subunit